MKLDRAWFADMTEAAFRHTIDAAIKAHRQSYGSGEPARKMEDFMAQRGHTLGGERPVISATALTPALSQRQREQNPSTYQSSSNANTAPAAGVSAT